MAKAKAYFGKVAALSKHGDGREEIRLAMQFMR